MLRPNYAMDAPPTVITVGGADYRIDTDWRTWIEITRMMRAFIPGAERMEDLIANARNLRDMQVLAFGGVLADEDAGEVLQAMSEFARGYPEAPIEDDDDGGGHAQTYSFDYDLNYIIIAIRNQSGIDLSYRRTEPFHWWEFLLEFRSLCGEHYILKLMEIRGYDGDDRQMRRMAGKYALPRENTRREQEILDTFNELFWGA